METIHSRHQPPVYSLEPDTIAANKHFRMYNFEGTRPDHADFLIPHRKNHYLIVFVRRGGNRQWLDMTPVVLKDNTLYFTGLNQIILKEEARELWSTGIAFTPEFLSFQDNASLFDLPLIRNPHSAYELSLTQADIDFVEDALAKLNLEYRHRGEWQQRMLGAYLTVLLTYLSRLYAEQHRVDTATTDKLLVKKFQARINEDFRELREVGDYASQLYISAGHLSEVVKTQTGKPAIKHIHDRVILEARRLLFHTSHSLKEIAFELGFAEASYFNRFFKRETGVTPADYRSSIREMYH